MFRNTSGSSAWRAGVMQSRIMQSRVTQPRVVQHCIASTRIPLSFFAMVATVLIALASASLGAQTTTMPGMTMPGMDHSRMKKPMEMANPLGVPMDRSGSGTTWIPDAVRLPTYNRMAGNWHLMVHGFVFAQYNKQGSDRGDEQFGSLNWGMFMASRTVKGGRFQVRSMLSVDAATVSARGYPLLAQSGETYNGAPIHDRQHPHDFFMELGATYERPVTSRVGVSVYVAPSGEPALGPVAFMHRPSAMDLPTAPLGHHWQDATHVAFGVLTAGVFTHRWKLETSVFNGREPDQYRWNFDKLALDSWSVRSSFNPTDNWALSAGYGFLDSPEILHPEESLHRVVGSIMHGVGVGTSGQWSSTLVYGVNKHGDGGDGVGSDEASHGTSAYSQSILAESELLVNNRNTVFARAEMVQKNAEDLVLNEPSLQLLSNEHIPVKAFSLGYIRELLSVRGATIGLGGMGAVNVLPSELVPYYGSRTPMSGMVFLRLRPVLRRSMPGMAEHGM